MAEQQQAVRVLGDRQALAAPEPTPTGDNHDVRVLSGGGAVVPKPPTVTLMVQAELEVETDRLAGNALTREEASAYVDRAHPAVQKLAAQLVNDDPSARVRVTVGPYVVNKRGSWSS
jgi:hypothetical protein